MHCLLSVQDGVKLEMYFAGGRLTSSAQGQPVSRVDWRALKRLMKASPKVRAVVLEDGLFRHCFEKTGALLLFVLACGLF